MCLIKLEIVDFWLVGLDKTEFRVELESKADKPYGAEGKRRRNHHGYLCSPTVGKWTIHLEK